jgi:hypothetical protein
MITASVLVIAMAMLAQEFLNLEILEETFCHGALVSLVNKMLL